MSKSTRNNYITISSRFNKSLDSSKKNSANGIRKAQTGSNFNTTTDKLKLDELQCKIAKIKDGLKKHSDYKIRKDSKHDE